MIGMSSATTMVNFNGFECEALLDNGSDRSLISKSWLEKYCILFEDSVKMTDLSETTNISLEDYKPMAI